MHFWPEAARSGVIPDHGGYPAWLYVLETISARVFHPGQVVAEGTEPSLHRVFGDASPLTRESPLSDVVSSFWTGPIPVGSLLRDCHTRPAKSQSPLFFALDRRRSAIGIPVHGVSREPSGRFQADETNIRTGTKRKCANLHLDNGHRR